MNKKGFGVFPIVLIIIGVIALFYLLLYLPFPSFQKIRAIVNYFSIYLLFLAVQIGILYGYYKLGFYVVKATKFYNTKIASMLTNLKNNVERIGLK